MQMAFVADSLCNGAVLSDVSSCTFYSSHLYLHVTSTHVIGLCRSGSTEAPMVFTGLTHTRLPSSRSTKSWRKTPLRPRGEFYILERGDVHWGMSDNFIHLRILTSREVLPANEVVHRYLVLAR